MVQGGGRPAPWSARAADLPQDLTDARLTALLSGSDDEVGRRLMEGDPLGLRGVAMARLREEGLLLSPDRVLTRLAARVVYESSKLGTVRAFRRWVYRAAPKVLRELVREDAEADREATESESDAQLHHGWLAQLLGIPPELARSASIAFNRLPRNTRCAFFEVVLLRTPLGQYADTAGLSGGDVEARIAEGSRAISDATGTGDSMPEGGGS